jgi:hypothetical protein
MARLCGGCPGPAEPISSTPARLEQRRRVPPAPLEAPEVPLWARGNVEGMVAAITVAAMGPEEHS